MYCLFCVVLCVNVYSTTATGWQPNCSLTNISYHISISNVSRFYRLIYWQEIATTFTINKSRKNNERHLPSRSTTQNLCHLKHTLPTKFSIPCHTATNGAQIRRTQILTSPDNEHTYRISSGRSLSPLSLEKFSGATTCKNERRMQWRFKTAHKSHKTRFSCTKANHHNAPTETNIHHVHKSRGTTVKLSYVTRRAPKLLEYVFRSQGKQLVIRYVR